MSESTEDQNKNATKRRRCASGSSDQRDRLRPIYNIKAEQQYKKAEEVAQSVDNSCVVITDVSIPDFGSHVHVHMDEDRLLQAVDVVSENLQVSSTIHSSGNIFDDIPDVETTDVDVIDKLLSTPLFTVGQRNAAPFASYPITYAFERILSRNRRSELFMLYDTSGDPESTFHRIENWFNRYKNSIPRSFQIIHYAREKWHDDRHLEGYQFRTGFPTKCDMVYTGYKPYKLNPAIDDTTAVILSAWFDASKAADYGLGQHRYQRYTPLSEFVCYERSNMFVRYSLGGIQYTDTYVNPDKWVRYYRQMNRTCEVVPVFDLKEYFGACELPMSDTSLNYKLQQTPEYYKFLYVLVAFPDRNSIITAPYHRSLSFSLIDNEHVSKRMNCSRVQPVTVQKSNWDKFSHRHFWYGAKVDGCQAIMTNYNGFFYSKFRNGSVYKTNFRTNIRSQVLFQVTVSITPDAMGKKFEAKVWMEDVVMIPGISGAASFRRRWTKGQEFCSKFQVPISFKIWVSQIHNLDIPNIRGLNLYEGIIIQDPAQIRHRAKLKNTKGRSFYLKDNYTVDLQFCNGIYKGNGRVIDIKANLHALGRFGARQIAEVTVKEGKFVRCRGDKTEPNSLRVFQELQDAYTINRFSELCVIPEPTVTSIEDFPGIANDLKGSGKNFKQVIETNSSEISIMLTTLYSCVRFTDEPQDFRDLFYYLRNLVLSRWESTTTNFK